MTQVVAGAPVMKHLVPGSRGGWMKGMQSVFAENLRHDLILP